MPTFTENEFLVITSLLGLLIGSFISMLSWRLPRIMDLPGEEQLKIISFSRSKCPHCNTALSWKQLFPLFSWLFSKGKCTHCHHPISVRYPLIEFTTMILTFLVAWHFGVNQNGIIALVFTWILLTITVIDIEHQLILDILSLPLLWLGLLINTQSHFVSPSEAILGAALGYILLWTIFYGFKVFTGKEGMGFGDFKLLAALGAWFGASAIPQIILIASISSLIIALVFGLLKLRNMKEPIPFGPFLALGGIATLLFGNQFILAL